MHDLGDKIASTLVAQAASVPCVPWSGSHVSVDYANTRIIPDDKFRAACVRTLAEAEAAIKQNSIAFPIMLKASEGGGGKGIRKVPEPAALGAALRQVQSEVPGSPIFIMQLVSNARHLEVQVLGDAHGNAIALHGRDCSIQRRHQKIVEEGPPIAAKPDTWTEMERGAVRLAKQVGYVSAGTVEYLYRDGEYFFLELNPRLQVEHPVTEEIMQVNMPACQLMVAMGLPLYRIRALRVLYNADPDGTEPIDFDVTPRRPPSGHCIAVRITGENPDQGFKPTSGRIDELTFRSSPNVWGYFSVGGRGGIHEYADSQFGHVFARGNTRDEARIRMVLALREISIRGEIRTPVEYLAKLLESDDFKSNSIHTGWLDARLAAAAALAEPAAAAAPTTPSRAAEAPPMVRELSGAALVPVMCGALVRAWQRSERRWEAFSSDLVHGRQSAHALQTRDDVDLIFAETHFQFVVRRTGPYHFLLSVPHDTQHAVLAELRPLSDGGVLVLIDGHKHTCYSREDATGLRLQYDGRTLVFENENDPSQLRTATPGKLARQLVENGTHIAAGTAYAEIEVMKMFLPLTAHAAGVIRFLRTEGASLDAGAVVATLQLDDESAVRRAKPFQGTLPVMGAPHAPGCKPAQVLRACLQEFYNALHGYEALNVRGIVDALLEVLGRSDLPVSEFGELLASMHGRLPGDLESATRQTLDGVSGGDFKDTASIIAAQIEHNCDAVAQFDEKARAVAVTATAPLRELCRLYQNGVRGRMQRVLSTLLQHYVALERRFEDRNADDVLFAAREQYSEDPKHVFEIALSRARPRAKTQMIGYLIDRIGALQLVDELTDDLQELSNLQGKNCIDAVLRARQVLMRFQLPSFKQRQVAIEHFLREALALPDADERTRRLLVLADQSPSIFDVLVTLFAHANKSIRCAAMEVYVRRAYRSYAVENLTVDIDGSLARANWTFAPLHLSQSQSLTMSTDSNAPRPADDGRERTLEEHLAQSMLRNDSLDNLALAGELHQSSGDVHGGADSERARAMRSARMLCCPTLAEAMAKFDMFIDEWQPPRLKFGDEFLNVLNIVVLGTPVAAPPSPTSGAPAAAGSGAAGAADDGATSPIEVLSPSLSSRRRRNTANAGELAANETDALFGTFVRDPQRVERLLAKGVRRITLVLQARPGAMPAYYTFRERLAFKEDAIHRHFEPTLGHMYQLSRMSNYDIDLVPTENSQIHMYFGREHAPPAGRDAEKTFFARAVLREGDLFAASDRTVMQQRMVEFLQTEVEKLFTDMIDALELAAQMPRYEGARNHHIYINIVPEFQYNPELVDTLIQKLGRRYGARLWRLAVGELEVCVLLRGLGPTAMPLRFIVTNPTGLDFQIVGYCQVKDLKTGVESFSHVYGTGPKDLDGLPILTPYRVLDEIGRRRFRARAESTTYCYDFPALFATAARREWQARQTLAATARLGVRIPSGSALFQSVELVLSANDEELVETKRAPGLNDVGMVAWRMHIATPEFPKGRDIIVIANDITHVIGSFGPREDIVFAKATLLAMRLGLPRLYVSANSGARIGVAAEVQRSFGVEWVDSEAPTRGFRYLYVDEATRKELGDAVRVEPVAGAGGAAPPTHFRITDIIGREHGIGVENLQGSGHIAGLTSRAYEQIFTASLVTGRTVGIGAYLVRLGQRMIQNQGPVLLTGAGALNTVLGRDVYTSNNQIGGTQIMYANGVSHLVVSDELRGVQSLLQWLGYVRDRRDGALPVLDMFDPLDRAIEFDPNGQPYDPRHLIGGAAAADGRWVSGFFDRDSFVETLGGWAKTVVTGRARLGGVPIGVIIAETRTVEQVTPADPATATSIEVVTQQAGQVWFPDSAYKTATAIRDFNHGEQLPLMIFANWRGFSGGMRDMFEEILKYGSYIVDELSHYQQPVFVYIPPLGELRGGAWVVLDPTINTDWMEMYCDERGRGGVLEPQGLVSVKYRQKDLLATMRRLDQRLVRMRARVAFVERQLKVDAAQRKQYRLTPTDIEDDRACEEEDADAAAAPNGAGKPIDEAALRVTIDGALHDATSEDVVRVLGARIASREKALLPIYNQIAVSFADLHDTPGRMRAKGVISDVLKWRDARRFFGLRLRRRLAEASAIKQLREASPELSVTEARALLRLLYSRNPSRAIDEHSSTESPYTHASTAFATARSLLRRMLDTAAAAAAAAAGTASSSAASASAAAATDVDGAPISSSPGMSPSASSADLSESIAVSGSPPKPSSSSSTAAPALTVPRSPQHAADWDDDTDVTEWLNGAGRASISDCCARLRAEEVARTLAQTCERQTSDTIVEGIAAFLDSDTLPQDARVRFIDSLTKQLKDARSRKQGATKLERRSSLLK
jgi:acetyl-CoA carboxylase/biotin carboxylase 1